MRSLFLLVLGIGSIIVGVVTETPSFILWGVAIVGGIAILQLDNAPPELAETPQKMIMPYPTPEALWAAEHDALGDLPGIDLDHGFDCEGCHVLSQRERLAREVAERRAARRARKSPGVLTSGSLNRLHDQIRDTYARNSGLG